MPSALSILEKYRKIKMPLSLERSRQKTKRLRKRRNNKSLMGPAHQNRLINETQERVKERVLCLAMKKAIMY